MMRFAAVAAGTAILLSVSHGVQAQQRSGRATAARPPHAAPPVKPATVEKSVPFKVGETLTYDVSWSTFLVAGTAVFTVQDKKPSYNSTAYYILAEGRPVALVARLYPLYYKLDTLLDAYTLLPQRGSIYSEEGSRHKFRTTVFDRAGKKAQFESRTATIVKTEFPASAVVQDALSAIYVLRAIALRAGDRITMPVSDGGSNYQLQVDAAGPERIKSAALGETSAWRLTLAITDAGHQPVGKNLNVWVSDDARRLPVRMQADLAVGSFVLALREAH